MSEKLTREMIVEKYEYLTNRETSEAWEDLADLYSFVLAYFPERQGGIEPQPDREDSRLTVIRELVKPIAIADLVENGTDAPCLLAQRIRRIREVLEGRDNG